MKNIFNKSLALIISMVLLAACSFSVCAADVVSPLSFEVSSDGFATVTDCASDTYGVVIIPEKVVIDGAEYAVKYIGERAFDSCYGVSEIHIPEGVTAIKNFAFRDCVALTDVYVPESLVMCRYDVFDGCGKLTVHCYTSNYQFFTVYGFSANVDVEVLDADESLDSEGDQNVAPSEDFITRFIEALKNLINSILDYFGANDDEFEFPFASEFPFVDDLINEFEKI